MTDSETTRRGPDPETSAKISKETRRGFMFKVGAGLLSLGGLIIAAPIVGYIFAPAVKDFVRHSKASRHRELPVVQLYAEVSDTDSFWAATQAWTGRAVDL